MTAATARRTAPHPGRTPAPGRRVTGWRRHRRWVMPLAGAVFTLVLLSPYVVMVLNSLRPSGDVTQTPATFLPRTWQLTTYADVLTDTRFLNWLKTSVVVAGTSTVIVILVAIPAAYYTARYRFPGRIAFLLLVLVTQMFSPTALVVGIYREWFTFNMVNTYGALILTNAAFGLAFAVWILHGFFSSIPAEVEEAAHLDGLREARHPAADHASADPAGVVTAVIFSFIAAWNEYVVALTLMLDESRKPLTVGITPTSRGTSSTGTSLRGVRSSRSSPSSSSSPSSRSTSSAASPPGR